jgi:hypothetical protein
VLDVVIALRNGGPRSLQNEPGVGPPYVDVDNDGDLDFSDVLAVVIEVRADASSEGEPSEASTDQSAPVLAASTPPSGSGEGERPDASLTIGWEGEISAASRVHRENAPAVLSGTSVSAGTALSNELIEAPWSTGSVYLHDASNEVADDDSSTDGDDPIDSIAADVWRAWNAPGEQT